MGGKAGQAFITFRPHNLLLSFLLLTDSEYHNRTFIVKPECDIGLIAVAGKTNLNELMLLPKQIYFFKPVAIFSLSHSG